MSRQPHQTYIPHPLRQEIRVMVANFVSLRKPRLRLRGREFRGVGSTGGHHFLLSNRSLKSSKAVSFDLISGLISGSGFAVGVYVMP